MGLSAELLQDFPFELADELIESFGLHRTYPVNLAPLYEAFSIRIYRDVVLPKEVTAYSLFHKQQGHGIAVFTAGLDGPALTHAMGHEMGHLLCHKFHRVHMCASQVGANPQQELEADLLASYLIVPGRSLYELLQAGYSPQQIAARFNVPPAMLDYRIQLMLLRNEFGLAG
jgi:Zn-dependent peptidase ImmA (M78 family)